MSVGFHSVNSLGDCAICLESLAELDSLAESEVVAHDGGDGDKHPVHVKCIIQWMKVKSKCQSCRVPLDKNSILLLKHGEVAELKEDEIGEELPIPIQEQRVNLQAGNFFEVAPHLIMNDLRYQMIAGMVAGSIGQHIEQQFTGQRSVGFGFTCGFGLVVGGSGIVNMIRTIKWLIR